MMGGSFNTNSTALVVTMLLVALVSGCNREPARDAHDLKVTSDSPHATVFVDALGEIELNGKAADMQAVAEAFVALAKEHGVVLYSRESPERDPHPNGMQVIKLAVQNRLIIMLSKQRDFSDVVDADGKLKLTK